MYWLGLRSYAHARLIQDALVRERVGERREDCVVLFEHPPVVTLGRRAACNELLVSDEHLLQHGIGVQRADRGGAITFHGPGQLVIYPVVSLRARGFGVRRFVSEGLTALADVARAHGAAADARLDPAGVWTSGFPLRKLAAVGLRIVEGVTNHGFALNVTTPLAPYQWIVSCGLREALPASIASVSTRTVRFNDVLRDVAEVFEKRFLT